jgi:hypothetical protein
VTRTIPSTEMLRLVTLVRNDVSEEHVASIIIFLRSVLRLLVAANVDNSSPIVDILMMEVICSLETLFFTTTW